ncbi:hypothetical protein EYF80_034847 [Liparis tanakae]|uniref:Uncharacterized protein n=1 Tax=Liparis tanakae TaxID=230148 RepID=A0A4Z2GNQ2_9TELE|nr:hypothetical protein EYF80_034847 [Liparis tanakae]
MRRKEVEIQHDDDVCVSLCEHAIPRLWPTTETAPVKSACLCLKRAWSVLISEATVSTMTSDFGNAFLSPHLLVHPGGVAVQRAVPVDGEELHSSYLAFLLSMLINQVQRRTSVGPCSQYTA